MYHRSSISLNKIPGHRFMNSAVNTSQTDGVLRYVAHKETETVDLGSLKFVITMKPTYFLAHYF
jgi:hypothetical protein